MNSVSSGSEAGKSQNAGLLAKAKSPQLHNWLLIIVAGLIVLWLSVDALPPACTRLMQMLEDWSTLQAASGSAMIAPFAILLLQLLCFLVAWAIFVLAIVREILAFRERSGRARGSSSVSSAGPLTPSPMPDVADAVAPQDNEDENIPFDINSAIFELLPDQEEAEPEIEEEELLTSAIVEEEAVFVYGDPLAGDLPEIFNYDTDLMRDVQEQREKARAQIQTDRAGDGNEKEEPEKK